MSTSTPDQTAYRRAAAQHAVAEHLRWVSSGQIEQWLESELHPRRAPSLNFLSRRQACPPRFRAPKRCAPT